MELVRRGVERKPPVGIELVLTVAEEQGLRGAKAFDVDQLRSPRSATSSTTPGRSAR